MSTAHSASTRSLSLAILLLASSTASAQIPAGWYVFGTFGGAGRLGIFTNHPRTPASPAAITNLQGDLTVTGASCILYRESDGAVLVGERAPTGASVDLHVLTLRGTAVELDASFSVGVGGPCCGEIPQMALLPDGRVVLAATDVDGGPLQNYLTTQYGWQGLGIVDTRSGLVSPITVTNGASITDVFNGLALSDDGRTIYVGTYVSASQGDVYSVPIGGGPATLVATVPHGLSNLAVDADGQIWVTTLDSINGLFRIDPSTGSVTPVPQNNGALNGIRYEKTTGNFAVVSASRGAPRRSLFWMEPNGTEHLLADPMYATPSGVDVHPNPRVFGRGTPGAATYDWAMPNPQGLPLVGNAGFGLTLDVQGQRRPGVVAIALAEARRPVRILGNELFLDPATIVTTVQVAASGPSDVPLGLPNDPSFVGASLFLQSFHVENVNVLSSSPAVQVTVL